MKVNAVEQVRKIIEGVTAEQDIAEIEKVVAEARGRVPLETAQGFWVGKRACWEMCQCPDMIKNECAAPRYQMLPCWEVEGTYCKLDDYGTRGDDTSICEVCWVYKRWGEGRPIEIKLRGKGINASLKSIGSVAHR